MFRRVVEGMGGRILRTGRVRAAVAISCGVLATSLLVAAGTPRGQAGDPTPSRSATPVAEAAGAAAPSAVPPGAQPQAPQVPPPWQPVVEAWKAQESVAKDPADNSFCLVCHVNYQDETLVKDHRPVGVGCEMCHGISDKHSEDEDGLIPPDILYVKEGVDAFCLACHPKEKLAGPVEHNDLFVEAARQPAPQTAVKTCAECHAAEHQMKVRTRRWNKQTRELEWSDGVRMMETRPE